MALGSRDLLPRRMETARSWEAGGRGACGGEAGRAEHEARDRWREGTDGLMASASLFEDPLSNGSGPASLVSSIVPTVQRSRMDDSGRPSCRPSYERNPGAENTHLTPAKICLTTDRRREGAPVPVGREGGVLAH